MARAENYGSAETGFLEPLQYAVAYLVCAKLRGISFCIEKWRATQCRRPFSLSILRPIELGIGGGQKRPTDELCAASRAARERAI